MELTESLTTFFKITASVHGPHRPGVGSGWPGGSHARVGVVRVVHPQRLRQAAGEVLVVAPAPDMPDPVTLIQTMMLECVGALDQLHAALKHDRTLLADLTS